MVFLSPRLLDSPLFDAPSDLLLRPAPVLSDPEVRGGCVEVDEADGEGCSSSAGKSLPVGDLCGPAPLPTKGESWELIPPNWSGLPSLSPDLGKNPVYLEHNNH